MAYISTGNGTKMYIQNDTKSVDHKCKHQCPMRKFVMGKCLSFINELDMETGSGVQNSPCPRTGTYWFYMGMLDI